MSTRPTLSTLISRAQGDISGRTEGSAYISHSVERYLANVLAGIAHGLYGHLEWVKAEYFPTSASIEGLRAWGAIIGLPQGVATFAEREVEFTGTNGTVIPVGTQMQDDAGLVYEVFTAGTINVDGIGFVEVRALTAGTDSNLTVGAPLTLTSPIAGVDSEGEVSAPLVDAVDDEEVEDYRSRILGNLRTPPSGGGPGDYVTWAREVPGVTRAWEFGNRMGIGTVSVAFVRDNDGDIIPSAGEVTEVQEYIESVMPLDIRALYVQAPVEVPVNLTIALRPNTADVRASVTAELTELFATETELEVALPQSRISEAISTAEGEEAHSITAISSLTPGTWGLLTLGTLTFNTLSS